MVDVGVAADLEPVPGLLPRKIARGTADFTEGPAMTRDQATAAVVTGAEIARDLVAAGNRCLVTGDMGIANTTASAALICAFTGADPAEATGRGTGIDAATYAQEDRGGLPRPGQAPSRPPDSPGSRSRPIRWASWRRSAASSTPPWPGSSSAPPRCACR